MKILGISAYYHDSAAALLREAERRQASLEAQLVEKSDPEQNPEVRRLREREEQWRSERRSLAERIVYAALEGTRDKTGTDPVVTLKRAMDNVRPALEVKSRRVGGATYQVPVEVRPERRTALAMRWLISYSRDRNEKSMAEKLAAEVIAVSKGEGNAVKKKEDTHRMADANKAFAHYRW